ncbi:MarR family winged helix-turn-helix transcriptional regulator [Microbacterium gilvum]|uniref:HTH marR-type domain-containing protein n=1 Tax=Microbacterium gilvum TaxID=1336204 RepID=A0ABP9AIE3_9MICO
MTTDIPSRANAEDTRSGAADVAPEQAEAIKAVEAEFSELMTQVRRIIHQHAERVSPGLNPGAYKIFTSIVRHGPVTSSDMVDRMAVDKGQLSRTIRELEGLGLIARTPAPSDRRVSLLEATPEGIRRLEAARSHHESLLYDTLRLWDVDRVRDLAELLHALTNGVTPEAR